MIAFYMFLLGTLTVIVGVFELFGSALRWSDRRRRRRILVVDLTATRTQARPWSGTK